MNLSTITAEVKASANAVLNGSKPERRIEHKDVLKEIMEIIEPLDFRQLAGVEKTDKVSQKHQRIICVDQLLKLVRDKRFDLVRKNDYIYSYNGEFWKEIGKEAFEHFLCQVAIQSGVKWLEARDYDFRNKIFNQFIADAYLEPVKPPNNTVLINLQNGTFEISSNSQQLREFRASDFLTYQLPFEFAPQAECPLFFRYLNCVLPEKELQDILAEFFGYVFIRHLKLERALLLYGEGENGKSVMFDIINGLLGKQNVSNLSLANLMEEHNRALLANKLLNYGSEINARGINVEIVKNLVSTEPVQARLKYGQSFELELLKYAKLCFNCNTLPKDVDHTHAYFRRLLIVPFRVRISPEEKDVKLAEKIVKNELSGVFNWILEGLRRLLKNEDFTRSEIVKAEIEAYRKESDSAAMFLEESCYQKVSDRESATYLKTIYAEYKLFCQDSGFRSLNIQNLANRFKALGFDCVKTKTGVLVYAAKK